tara:strand:- start:621 stop:1664 length:1044 start_codon:yes stop_codon:yes gene_type:complete
MKQSSYGLGIAAAAIVAVTATSTFAGEKTLKTVTALQQTNVLAKSYLKTFVGPANTLGKGLIQVKNLGGQEIVPPRKAAAALKRGQFDILSCPTAYYIGTVPEGYGLLASNQGPSTLRANGGFKLLQKIYKEKAGSHLLAWGENLTSYYMYLAKKPKMGKDGVPNLTGMKMRATGTYRPLFRALGATTVNIKSSEIFTAMQRKTVDGYGMTDSALIAIGLQPVTNYRVWPNFYVTNQVVTVNLNTWNSLTQKQRDFLNNLALHYETSSVLYVELERQKEEIIIAKTNKPKTIKLKGAAARKYLATAYAEVWKELKKRSKYHDQLKPLLYVQGKPNRQIDFGDDRLIK